jgi:DNA-binding IclR family transcriptional regulator
MSSVQSVARAFTILQAIAAEPEGLSLTEIAQQVELPKSTVSRLLATMERFEVVERLPDTGGICIGKGIVSMAMQMPYRRYLTVVAHPIMQRLANEIGEAVSLCLPTGDQVHYVDQVQSHYYVQVRDWTGSRFPMHIVSAGKLFMSEWESAVLDRYLSGPLAQFTPHTHNTPDALQGQLITIRETGVSWAIDEFEVGLTAVSAPIREATQQLIAAVNIYGPGFRFPGEKSRAEINEHVIAASNLISERLQRLP